MNIIKLKIDVKKLRKEFFFQGKTGALYADITLLPNRNGPDQYGNDYMCIQDVSKEARERGEKGPIIGNAKELQPRGQQSAPTARPQQQQSAPQQDDEVPFK